VIVKITRGTSIRGLVEYLFGPGKHNEHYGQHIVAGDQSLEDVPQGPRLTAAQVREVWRTIDAPRISHHVATGARLRVKATAGGPALPGLEAKEKRAPGVVWQLSMTTAGEDRALSDAEWGEIAQGAMETVGFTEAGGKAPVRWVAVRHGLSVGGNDHVHVAVSLVREDGTKPSVYRDYVKMSAFAAEVERRYGLVTVDGRKSSGLPGLTRAEIERARRDGSPEPDRTRLARVVREAAVDNQDEAEFVRRLRQAGVSVRPRFAEGGQEKVVGYSVGLPGHDGKTIWFGGGSLAPDLSLPRLRSFWEATPQATTAAVAAWRGAKSPRGRETRMVSGPEWTKRAAAAVDQAYDKLKRIPPDDHAQWASVAREAAGVYAAWSRRVEGDQPGPLARAADALARSAQVAPETPSPVRSPIRGYRGAAMVVAQGNYGFEDRGTGWAMLLGQMNRTLRLLAKVHETRGELRQAQQLRAVGRDLEAVREQGGAAPHPKGQKGSRGPGSSRGTTRTQESQEEAAESRRGRRPGAEAGRGR